MAQQAFAEALAAFSETTFAVACCRSADAPLVFVSPAFCGLTGYELSECLGRNCRFLQGRGSSRRSVRARHSPVLPRASRAESAWVLDRSASCGTRSQRSAASVCVSLKCSAPCRSASSRRVRAAQVCLLNYTRSQEKFWNQCLLLPVRQAGGQARFYLGLSHSRPDSPARGRHGALQHTCSAATPWSTMNAHQGAVADGQSGHAAWRECCPQLREAQQQQAAQICSALQALLAGALQAAARMYCRLL